jgi:hypothetical protein
MGPIRSTGDHFQAVEWLLCVLPIPARYGGLYRNALDGDSLMILTKHRSTSLGGARSLGPWWCFGQSASPRPRAGQSGRRPSASSAGSIELIIVASKERK